MDRFLAMKTFVAVAETGGFAKAARQLQMSPPAVTRTVAALEDQIGTRLLTRTTRAVKLTEPGTKYLDDCRRILADVAEAEAAANGSYVVPTGSLTVTAPVQFGQIYVLPLMTAFLTLYPNVTGWTVFVDRVTNLVDEGFDVAVRIGHLPDSSLSAIKVGEVRMVAGAAPSYLAKYGEPTTPQDLSLHRIVAMTSAFTSLDWRFQDNGKPLTVTVDPRLYCNTAESVLTAVRQGWGLCRILSYQAAQAEEVGDFRRILQRYEEPALPIHILHAEGRRASAKVRAFVDFAVERLRSDPTIQARDTATSG